MECVCVVRERGGVCMCSEREIGEEVKCVCVVRDRERGGEVERLSVYV